MSRTRQIKSSVHIPISGFNYFFSALGRHHSMAWAWMAIRVSGQRQKHGASLADEIAKWLLRFSGDPLPPPSYILQNTLLPPWLLVYPWSV
jgi:hypothetical protein